MAYTSLDSLCSARNTCIQCCHGYTTGMLPGKWTICLFCGTTKRKIKNVFFLESLQLSQRAHNLPTLQNPRSSQLEANLPKAAFPENDDEFKFSKGHFGEPVTPWDHLRSSAEVGDALWSQSSRSVDPRLLLELLN